MSKESFPPTNLEISNDTKPIYCDGCKNENKEVLAGCYCPSCKVHFCSECDSFHDNHPLFKNHVRDPVNQEILKKKTKQIKQIVVPNCKIHQEKIGLYCFDCLSLICFNCAFSKTHKGHNIKPIQEAAEMLPKLQEKTNINEKIQDLLKRKKKQKKSINKEIKEIQNDQETLIKQTKGEFTKFIQQLEEKSTELSNYIAMFHDKQNILLKEEIQKINLQMETLESSLKNSEKNYTILEQSKDIDWYKYLDAFSQLKKILLFIDSPEKAIDKIALKRFEGQLVFGNVEKNISKIRFIKPFDIENAMINVPNIMFNDHFFLITIILKNEQNKIVNIANIENLLKLRFILNDEESKKKTEKEGGKKEKEKEKEKEKKKKERKEKEKEKEMGEEEEIIDDEKEKRGGRKGYLVPKFIKELSHDEIDKEEKGKGVIKEGNNDEVASYYQYTTKFKLKHTGFYDAELKVKNQKTYISKIMNVIKRETDKWDKEKKGSAISLYNLKKTAKCDRKNKGEMGSLTIKGTKILLKGIHCFQIRIDDIVGPLDIGVMPSRASGFPFKLGWVYDVYKGTKLHMQVPDGKYGEKCKNGDIVTILINLVDHTLSFWKNETDFGVAFTEISPKIVLAISLTKGSKVTIL
ncbi:e3 ubiquitin-protein ligase trim [Anaeramoeba flamelloides]|uniref:E3 ubiquitin-protein ligase trim n=1 Tax=Anaeramoeba flamelloides TaxID=1746091 RepID=A0AAV7ZMC6_9EUKA|nr:e3 ubiquitin-protein ligase trim [Anaeramoeba flamelloides]